MTDGDLQSDLPSAVPASPLRPLASRLLAAAFFLLVWGANLVVIDRFGSDLPFWDQWEREGRHVLRAWTENGDTPRALLTPHNEHRIVPTLATNLALTALGGQWDARVQCLVSAALHALILGALFLWALRTVPLRWSLLAGTLLALLGAAPIVWENLLSGFQSQFHFLAGFSLFALHGLLTARAYSLRWWLALAAGALALVSMGSGLLWTLPALLVSALRLRTSPAPGSKISNPKSQPPDPETQASNLRSQISDLKSQIPTALLLAAGLVLHTGVPAHAGLQAQTLGAACLYAARCLAWPWPELPWLSILLWLPWLVLAFRYVTALRRRTAVAPADEFLVAAGLWVLLQVAAVSWSRGAVAELPANRYGDLCALGLALSILSLARLGPRLREPLPLAGPWTLLVLGALASAAHHAWTVHLPARKAEHLAYERSVHAFILQPDVAALARQPIPFPNADWLAELLQRPALRPLLPASVRAPLAIPDLGNPTPPPAPTPPLPHRPVRTLLAPGEWRSAPLPAGSGFWKFETAGHLGSPGTSLTLVTVRDQRVLATLVPSRRPGFAWRSVHVPAPSEPAVLVARTDSPDRWFAFGEPVAVSPLSHYTRLFVKEAWLLPLLALPLLAAALRFGPSLPSLHSRLPISDLKSRISNLLPALLASTVVVLPFLPAAKSTATVFALEAQVRSDKPGHFQIYYDHGAGISETHSGRAALVPGASTRLTVPVTAGNYRLLRVDPIDGAGSVTLESLRLVSLAGWTVAELPLSALKPHHQIASARLDQGVLHLVSTPDADDPQLLLEFSPPLAVDAGWRDFARGSWRYILPTFAVFVALLWCFQRSPLTRTKLATFAASLAHRPATAVALVAAVAVVASAYPVVFLGKSFVSPNFGTPLLYDEFPTLPGSRAAETVDAKMSDVGAIIWQHVPFSTFQHRALTLGELPLWNRYNAAGVPLLAQGQSMFGDPLHFLVIAAGGTSWAWDLKYLVAKWLFATGLALCVLTLLRPPPTDLPSPISNLRYQISDLKSSPLLPSLLIAAAAPFIGFFLYRINHPAFFSLCYAPWPLWCYLRIGQATTTRALVLGCATLILANLAVMTSGTVKEAYMLLLCVNLAGAATVLAVLWPASRTELFRLSTPLVRATVALAAAGFLFVLLTAPLWATFLQTLRNAYTGYNAASAYQLQPTLLLGFFDEIFYRVLMSEERVFNPSLNFLLLLGFLYWLATLRTQFAHRAAVALALVSLLPLALAFGLVSPHWIVRLPFLANVAHIDNTFSCVLIVLWTVLAGLGFATAARRLGTPEGRGDLIVVFLLLGTLVFGWLAFGHAAHRPIAGPTVTVNQVGQTLPVPAFIRDYLVALLLAAATLAWLVRRAAVRRHLTPAAAMLVAVAIFALLWRHGFHTAHIGFEAFTARPPARTSFHARSDAMEFARAAHAREPFRGYGLRGNFFPGWTGIYGLETVHGPDALVNPWLRELVGVSGVNRIWDWRLYSEAPEAAQARPFFDALNVRFYFETKSSPALPAPFRLAHAADLDVYESPTAWPRAFFTPRLETYDDPAELIPRFRAAGGVPFAAIQRSDPATPALLAQLPPAQNPQSAIPPPQSPASAYRLTENTTSFRLRASGPGVIVLTEAWWPDDFVAELNGRRVPLFRVNHAFKGLLVDAPGDYTVSIRYWPKNFTRNLLLSAAAFAVIATVLVLTLRRPRRSAAPLPAVRPA